MWWVGSELGFYMKQEQDLRSKLKVKEVSRSEEGE